MHAPLHIFHLDWMVCVCVHMCIYTYESLSLVQMMVYPFKPWTVSWGYLCFSYKRSPFFPSCLQRSSESDFIWEMTFLILCRARSTLTSASTKSGRLRHPVLVLLLFTPVYQIIEGQAACLGMCLLLPEFVSSSSDSALIALNKQSSQQTPLKCLEWIP